MSADLSKAQRRALGELGRGETCFGPGFLYMYTTGRALVERGLAVAIDDRAYCSSADSTRRRRRCLRARISDAGRAALKE